VVAADSDFFDFLLGWVVAFSAIVSKLNLKDKCKKYLLKLLKN
jgi:hypothetical protein